MAIVKGSNSYVSVAEAEAYFEDRLDVAAWVEADDDQKSKALVTATAILDVREWTGMIVDDSQTLAFPRKGTYFDPRKGKEIRFTTDIPDAIVKATYELAYHLLNNDGLLDDTGGVDSLTLGNISLNQIKAPSQLPAHVYRAIRPMLFGAGANSWWRAN